MFFDHLAHILQGVKISAFIPPAVEVNSLPLSNDFECNYGMEVVLHSIDLGCWPPKDVVAQAIKKMSALIHAARKIWLQLSKNVKPNVRSTLVCFWRNCRRG